MTRSRWTRRAYPYLLMAPGLLAVLVFTLMPIVYSVYIAFTNYSPRYLRNFRFVGLENFRRILVGVDRGNFVRVLTWTLTWAVLTTLLNLALGLVLALLLNNPRLRERGLYRTILIYPWALPATLTVMVWGGLLNTSFGQVNQVLQLVGVKAIPWLTDPTWARVACILVNLWLAYPFTMSVFLGALQCIDAHLYEAAALDGASGSQSFRHITLPLLQQSTLPLLITSFAGNFAGFGVIYLLTGGGPIVAIDPRAPGATDLIGTYMYKLAFGDVTKNYGLAAATGIIIFLFTSLLTVLNSRLTGVFAEVDQ